MSPRMVTTALGALDASQRLSSFRKREERQPSLSDVGEGERTEEEKAKDLPFYVSFILRTLPRAAQ